VRDHPSILSEVQRLKTVVVPKANGHSEPTEQMVLIPPDPSEGQHPYLARRRRK
jgi:hypothetical protein